MTQGRPADVREISELLVSPDLYGSADAFNHHMRDKLTDLVLERVLARLGARQSA